MLNKKNFFKDFFSNSKKFSKNINEAKKELKSLELDLKNNKIPLLNSFKKKYNFDFSKNTIKKFSKYKNIIIVGMGGSILGTKSIYSFFKNKLKKKVFFFDNLDEYLFLELDKIKNKKNSCFIIVSKSGNTIETISNLGIIFSKFLLKKKLVFITQAQDSSLSFIANEFNSSKIKHKNYIAGRYSVLSEVGMFPAALMGLNINKFRNFEKLIKNKNFKTALIQNVASIYTLNNEGKNNSVILNYDSRLNDLSDWYQQLIGESLGKKGKGITTFLSPAPKDHHSLLQLYLDGPKDKFFTFFNSSKKKINKLKISEKIIFKKINFLKNKSLDFIINANFIATKNIFYSKKIPFRQFIFKKNNEEELGEMFIFLILETILLARMMNINPFNQPAVEQFKIETKRILLK